MAIPMQAPLETADQGHDWSALRGFTLEGGYELKEILSAEAERAIFRVRVLGDYSLRATASFYAFSGNAASEQVGYWEVVRRLDRTASVQRPLGTGLSSVSGMPTAYVILPETDETLADALSARALSGDEAREVLRSAAKALSELHAVGLVHGCVAPEEILATGDSILLSGESVRSTNGKPLSVFEPKYLAPESERENLTAASDVWCLGATLVEALTQKVFDRSNPGVVETLEHPFDKVASCCLEPDPDVRCKPGDLPILLSAPKPARSAAQAVRPVGKEPPPVERASSAVHAINPGPKTEPNGLQKGVSEPSASLPSQAAPSHKVAAPVFVRGPETAREPVKAELSTRRTAVPESEKTSKGFSRRWAYALACAAFFFLLVFFFRSQWTSRHISSQPGTKPAATPGTAWPTKTLGPPSNGTPGPAPSPAPVAAITKPVISNGSNPANWRVVLFTFNRQQDAETRATTINAKHPGLKASTFSPSGGGSPYLVVVGGPVTRAEATQMRLRALRSGMPRDTYIQNFVR